MALNEILSGPGVRKGAVLPVANTVSRSSTTSIVADNLWGSTPMNTIAITATSLRRTINSARWALLLRAGQSLLEPRLATVDGGHADR